jgi:curved DNA-binding protein CbpA
MRKRNYLNLFLKPLTMDYYEILEVPKTASIRQIRKHYYRLAKRYHPDKHPEDPQTERFKRLSEAYSTLSNPKKRYLYDIQREFSAETQSPDYKFSEADLETLYSYYERFVGSTEIRFLRTLYGSLPPTSKHTLHHNLKRCIHVIRQMFSDAPTEDVSEPCHTLYDIHNLKVIDASGLGEMCKITLQRPFQDVYENRCKTILVKLRDTSVHLYVTHSDYTIILDHLQIHIVTSLPPTIHLNGCDIYVERPINLYQHYFLRNYILGLASDYILYDQDDTTIEHKGLRDPRTNKRGQLHIYHQICLDVDEELLKTHKSILQKIFDFDVTKSRKKHKSSYKVC